MVLNYILVGCPWVKPKILGTIIENLPSTEVAYQICKCSRVNFHFCSSSNASNGPSLTQTLTLTAVEPEKFAKAKQSTCTIHFFEDFKICLQHAVNLLNFYFRGFTKKVLRVWITAGASCQQNLDSVAKHFLTKRTLLFGEKCSDSHVN